MRAIDFVDPLHDRPQTVKVVLGTTRQVMLKDLAWESGEVNGLTAGSGAKWSLARWLDGAPSKVELKVPGSGTPTVRKRAFGETDGGRFVSRFDGWGNPLAIEEGNAAWSQQFAMNDLPALTGANGPLGQEAFTCLPSGVRATGNGEPYELPKGDIPLCSP